MSVPRGDRSANPSVSKWVLPKTICGFFTQWQLIFDSLQFSADLFVESWAPTAKLNVLNYLLCTSFVVKFAGRFMEVNCYK